MLKKIISILIFALCLSGLFFVFNNSAEALYRVSDLISNSGPGIGANHTIQFRNVKEIPAGGKIVIDFDDNFIIPDDMDYADFDFALANNASGPYIDRELSVLATAVSDGIEIATTTKTITITFNSSTGVNAFSYMRIIIGNQAMFGEMGTSNIVNPSATRSYMININSYGIDNAYLEAATVSVAIIDPVTMGTYVKTRYLGASPVGWLNHGTTETIMSMSTNFPARCRYDVASGTPYASMSNAFSYASSTAYYFKHTVILSGLVNGGEYDYFIRCTDQFGVRDNLNDCFYSSASTTPYYTASGTPITDLECIDYYIPFSVSSQAGEGDGANSGEGTDPNQIGSGSSSGGGSGTGSGGGGGGGVGSSPSMYLPYPPPPGAPGVVFTGWAYPGREVVFLQDGVEQGRVLAKSDASFSAYVEELVRGVYTFGVWSEDSLKRRSNSFSTTFWLEANTQTTVSDIILAPTISIANTSITAGQMLETSGQSVPDAQVEVWLYPEKKGEVYEYEILKKNGLASKDGTWSLFLDTKDLTDGTYLVKARTTVSGKGTSDFSRILKANIGAAPVVKEGICAGADLNLDGKVNLTDFSILLYHWGSGHECADQNHDGIVNLTDFSIMMFYWTG